MKKLILRYNTRLGKDYLPKIESLTTEFGLRIDSIEEIKKESGARQKEIHVTGAAEGLQAMDKRLVRFASISRKSA